MCSLFCLIRVYIGLHFLQFFLVNWFFIFLCFLCFLLNQMFLIKILKYVLSLLKKVLVAMKFCSQLIKSHLINTKLFIRILLCKRHAFREVWNSQKIKECKKRYHKIIYESLSSISIVHDRFILKLWY